MFCDDPCDDLCDGTVELIRPTLDIAEEIQDALSESYHLHQPYLPWAVPAPSIHEVRSNLEQAMANFENLETEYRFFVRRLTDKKIVGCVGLHIRDAEKGLYEIGYWARASAQGKGYISRAVILLEKYACHTLGARHICLKTAASNTASQKVANACGFKLETIVEDDRTLASGEQNPTYVYYKSYE